MAQSAVPADRPEVPREFVELLRRLALVQDATGVRFPLPDAFSSDDVGSLIEGERLLLGDELVGEWSDATLDSLSEGVLDLIGDGAPAQVEIEGEVSIVVAGHSIPLGALRHCFASARLVNGDEVRAAREADRPVSAQMVPDSNESLVRRLVEPPRRPLGDPFAPTAIVSMADLASAPVTTLGNLT